jgi:pilus assembly protein Flp/PilA
MAQPRAATMFRRFLSDRRGATAIEYGLIAAVISMAIIGSLGLMSQTMNDNYQSSAGILDSKLPQ